MEKYEELTSVMYIIHTKKNSVAFHKFAITKHI